MSLLSICTNVLNIVGWDNITTVSSSTDKTARQILAICNQELENLSKRFNWPQLITENAFTTVSGQRDYPVPNGFEKLMQDSVYNKDKYYRLRSSMSDYQWNAWQFGLLGSLSHERYRLVYLEGSPLLRISPTPDTGENLVYFYKTKNLVKGRDGTFKLRYELDDDISILPEDVIQMGVQWRFRRAKGLDFSAELAEYNEMSRTRYAQSRGESDLPVPNGLYNPELTDGFVPSNGFGA